MENRKELAEKIFIALIGNPERYKYITNWFNEEMAEHKLKNNPAIAKFKSELQERANQKNINKAYKLADAFLEVKNNIV